MADVAPPRGRDQRHRAERVPVPDDPVLHRRRAPAAAGPGADPAGAVRLRRRRDRGAAGQWRDRRGGQRRHAGAGAPVPGPAIPAGGRPARRARGGGLIPADGLGYGLLMTALTLRVASIGAVVHVFNMAVMFFGGMFIPVTLFPHGIEIVARFVPTALGVEVLNTTLAGRGLRTAWADGTLAWLLVHTVALIGLGWITYLYTLRRARREGGLGPR